MASWNDWLQIIFGVLFFMELVNCSRDSSSFCTTNCSNQVDVECVVTPLPFLCRVSEFHNIDYPTKPEMFEYKLEEVNRTYLVKLSWLLPQGYSYKAVKGFMMSVNLVMQTPQCLHFNLSSVNWSSVQNVKDVKFSHCLEFEALPDKKRVLFLSLYSLPRPDKNADRAKLKIDLPAKPLNMDDDWYPNVSTSVEGSNMTAHFLPWYPQASFIKGCLVEIKQPPDESCTKETKFFHENSNQDRLQSTFIDVPCNKSYHLYMRAYRKQNGDAKPMNHWVMIADPVTMPCGPVPTTQVAPVLDDGRPDFVPLVLISLLVLCLITVSSALFWYRRSAVIPIMQKYLLCWKTPRSANPPAFNNLDEKIFPVFYPESLAYEQVVNSHIRLLRDSCGLNIYCYENQHMRDQEDMKAWVNENLKNSTVLLYYSKTVHEMSMGANHPSGTSSLEQVCSHALERLTELDSAGQAVVTVYVTFDGLSTVPAYQVDNLISLVKEEHGRLHVDTFETVVYRLTDSQSLCVPSEVECEDLLRYLYKLYDLDFDECLPELDNHESDPMMQDNGSVVSCHGSEIPYNFQFHHGVDMFPNPRQHCHTPAILPSHTEPHEHSISSGYNSNSTVPTYSGEFGAGHYQGHQGNHVPLPCRLMPAPMPHQNYGLEPYVQYTNNNDGDSTYTLHVEHLGQPQRPLDFIAPEMPASNVSLTKIQEGILRVNQSGF